MVFKQSPVYTNASLPSQTRKLRNSETAWPCAFHATRALVSLFPWLRARPQRREEGSRADEKAGSFSSICLFVVVVLVLETARDGHVAHHERSFLRALTVHHLRLKIFERSTVRRLRRELGDTRARR